MTLTKSHSYVARKNQRRLAASSKLHSVGEMFMLKMVFYAWLEDYKESRRAKRWFNREAGPEGEGEDESDWYWSEGEDPVSLLPREIAVKVSLVNSV